MNDYPVIDTWCNLFTPASMKKNYRDTPEMAYVFDLWRMTDRLRGWTTEEFAQVLDASGVSMAFIPVWQSRSWKTQSMLWDMDIEEVAEVMRADPARYKGMFGINPYHRMEGVRALERAITQHGFSCAHLHHYGYNLRPDDKAFFPFYAKCVELDVPVMIQMGHSAEFMPSEVGRPIYLDEIALYFPTLRIIAAHTGWPWVEELIAMAWKHPNVYISTTAHSPRYWDKSLVHFLNSRGKGKVMYGTDFPVVTHAQSLAEIDALGLKPEARKALLHDTAVKVFRLAPSPVTAAR
ncbi:MAG: amidohydrolase family protein [Rubrivivax sp.]|jgi:predicted TIM-barrel fold metal-dependent hydrolase